MPIKELKLPDQFIDRKVERDIFDHLLQFQGDARLLAIEDKEGTGKSALLKMLRYRSFHVLKKPVSIVPLDEPTINSPFAFVERLRDSFKPRGKFTNFDERNQNRIDKKSQIPTLTGAIDATNAVISGSGNSFIGASPNFAGPIMGPVTVNASNTIVWSEEQEAKARERCIEGFFEDLKSGDDLIVLIDSYDKCGTELREFIVDVFLETLCFNIACRPKRLILVLAGQELPNFEAYPQFVRSSALSAWEEDHVKEFLKVHGYEDLSEDDVDYVWKKVKKGVSIARALDLAATIKLLQ